MLCWAMNAAVCRMVFRDAVQQAFFKMQTARDQYRDACLKLGLVRCRALMEPHIVWLDGGALLSANDWRPAS